MAFCANCGAALTQTKGFCGSCGHAVGASSSTVVPAAQTAAVSSAIVTSQSGLTSNVAGALAYALGLITGVIFLVLEPYKNDRFVRFHAMQSVIFTAACIAFSIVWRIVVGILANFSVWIALVTLPIRLLISLAFFGLWVYVIYQAYNQREFHIPFIGDIAAKQAGVTA